MRVHVGSAVEQMLEGVHAGNGGDGDPRRRPERVAPAHPVPELEHAIGVDAELAGAVRARGSGHEVARHRTRSAGRAYQPLAGAGRVDEGFAGAEGLGDDDEERFFHVRDLEHAGELRGLDVRYEMRLHARTMASPQGFAHHRRTEVRTADADVHDVAQGAPTVSAQLSPMERVAEGAHPIPHTAHLRHHVPPCVGVGPLPAMAQGAVERGAVFGEIDILSAQQRLHVCGYVQRARVGEQELDALRAHPLFREVDEQPAGFEAEAGVSLRITREQVVDARTMHLAPMFDETFPCPGGVWSFCEAQESRSMVAPAAAGEA